MKKFYVASTDYLNELELKSGKVSYWRIIDRYIDNRVLCNNIEELEWCLNFNKEEYYNEDIYQYYLCNLSEFEKEQLQDYGIILSYSNKLELDILCVNHFGTSWDYVMTDVEWTTDITER